MKLILKAFVIMLLQMAAVVGAIAGVLWALRWFFFLLEENLRYAIIFWTGATALVIAILYAVISLVWLWYSEVYNKLKAKQPVPSVEHTPLSAIAKAQTGAEMKPDEGCYCYKEDSHGH